MEFRNEIDKITGKKKTMDIFEQVREIKLQEAVEERDRLFVQNLLKKTQFSLDKIASLVNVSLAFVKEVKKDMGKKKKQRSFHNI